MDFRQVESPGADGGGLPQPVPETAAPTPTEDLTSAAFAPVEKVGEAPPAPPPPPPDVPHPAEARLGHAFRDRGLLVQALTHSSGKSETAPSNERLEFLGDSVLGLVVARHLFLGHPS